MRIIPIILICLFLTSCACFKKSDPMIPPDKVVHIPTELLKDCPLLPEAVEVKDFADAIIAYTSLANAYGNCASKQASSVILLKQFGAK